VHKRLLKARQYSRIAGPVQLKVFPALIGEPGVQWKGTVMTATLEAVTKKKPEPSAEQAAAEELVRRAGSRACP
jgi:hypothetical protein